MIGTETSTTEPKERGSLIGFQQEQICLNFRRSSALLSVLSGSPMAAIVASVLAGLDEDLQEYIVGLCDDTDDDDDLKEAVAAFVLSSELVEEEDAAEAKAAELLEARLRLLGADVEATRLYRGWTHTDPILERPFAGDQRLHRDIFDLVDRWTGGGLPAFDGALPGLRRMCPQALIDFGHAAMPF